MRPMRSAAETTFALHQPPPERLRQVPSQSPPPARFARVVESQPSAPLQLLARGADLNPPASAHGSTIEQASPAATPVLRERDWGDTDLFSSLRTSFASSGLAGMGGVAPVDFIAPVEHMKRLITLPYTPGRVAFPVHRVGSALVIDGGVRSGVGRGNASSDAGVAGAAAERALADVLGRMIGTSSNEGAGAADGTSGGGMHVTTRALPAPPVADFKPAADEGSMSPVGGSSCAAESIVPMARHGSGGSRGASEGEGDGEDGWTPVKKRGNRSRSRKSHELLSRFLCHSVASADSESGSELPQPASVPPATDPRAAEETRWTLWTGSRGSGGDDEDRPADDSLALCCSSGDEEAGADRDANESDAPLTAEATAAVGGALTARTSGSHHQNELRMQRRAAAHAAEQEQRATREPPHPFRQVVHWQLQDLGMLLGTDQAVFASAEYPQMSLQLCDMRRPIRPLSILEFWLDNVMAAIPALAVCGHVDGLVKGYQVLKTDDLPHWPGASFDPDAVLGNAHQLLAFLQGHCTRPGGSYWVLKEPESNFLRVFDLATLSSEYGADANPFSHSVALMCFRMSSRPPLPSPGDADDDLDRASGEASSRETLEKRRELLSQCAELLNREEHPLLFSMVQLQLAQCYAALGVDEDAVANHPDVAGLLQAVANKVAAEKAGDTRSSPDASNRLGSAWSASAPEAAPAAVDDARAGALVRRDMESLERATEQASVSAHTAPSPRQPAGVAGLLRLLQLLDGALPRSVWPQASVLGHALSGLQSVAHLGTAASTRCEQALRVELPEVDSPSVSAARAELSLIAAGCCLDISRALATPEATRFASSRRVCATAALMLLRAAVHGLLLHVFRVGAEEREAASASIPPSVPITSPVSIPAESAVPAAQTPSTEIEARATMLMQHLAQQLGDAMRDMALCVGGGGEGGGGAGVVPDATRAELATMKRWLSPIDEGSADEGALRSLAEVVPRERDCEDARDCLYGACESYWWLLLISDQYSAAMRPHAIRRLGGVLNELGQAQLRDGKLTAADELFSDSLTAFAYVGDAPNSALLLLNKAAVARQRAMRFGSQTANGSAQLYHLLEMVEHQRAARRQLKQLRGGGPAPLRAMVLRDLAAGEAAAGGALHAIVAEGDGTEASVKKAGECLSSAQMLYEEIGELAQVQLMMRQQGSLYLAAALCASLEGESHERAAASRLTLALRHYERALAPQLLAQASVSPAMERCAAEAHLELANFFLTWSAGGAGGAAIGPGGMGAGERLKHLETSLTHARAPKPPKPDSAGLPSCVLEQLAEAEQRALRELIRAHTAAGNAARAAVCKEAYRVLLQEQSTSKVT